MNTIIPHELILQLQQGYFYNMIWNCKHSCQLDKCSRTTTNKENTKVHLQSHAKTVQFNFYWLHLCKGQYLNLDNFLTFRTFFIVPILFFPPESTDKKIKKKHFELQNKIDEQLSELLERGCQISDFSVSTLYRGGGEASVQSMELLFKTEPQSVHLYTITLLKAEHT